MKHISYHFLLHYFLHIRKTIFIAFDWDRIWVSVCFVFFIVGLFTFLTPPSSSSWMHSCSQYSTICWQKSRGQGKLGGGPAHPYQPGGSMVHRRIHTDLIFEASSQQSLSLHQWPVSPSIENLNIPWKHLFVAGFGLSPLLSFSFEPSPFFPQRNSQIFYFKIMGLNQMIHLGSLPLRLKNKNNKT